MKDRPAAATREETRSSAPRRPEEAGTGGADPTTVFGRTLSDSLRALGVDVRDRGVDEPPIPDTNDIEGLCADCAVLAGALIAHRGDVARLRDIWVSIPAAKRSWIIGTARHFSAGPATPCFPN